MDNSPVHNNNSSARSGHNSNSSVPDFTLSPYFSWLESVIRDIASENPKAISIEVVLDDGSCSTRYFNCNRGDRALMMAAMEEAQIIETIADYKEEILEILNGEGEEDDDTLPEDDFPDPLPDASAPDYRPDGANDSSGQ